MNSESASVEKNKLDLIKKIDLNLIKNKAINLFSVYVESKILKNA